MTEFSLSTWNSIWDGLVAAAAGDEWLPLLGRIFGGQGDEMFAASAETLRQQLLAGSRLGLQLEVRTADNMNGASAFLIADPAGGGGGTIVLNADRLSDGTSQEQLQALLLEQIGNAIDLHLNGSFDPSGSEGAAFALALAGNEPQQLVVAADGGPQLSEAANSVWQQALVDAHAALADLVQRSDRESLLADVFGRAGTDGTAFSAAVTELLDTLGGTGLQIAIDLRSNAELNGTAAAYASVSHTGSERIYINADRINDGSLSLALLTSALIEEVGHAIDQRLNAGIDSAGDEGQLFASSLTGVTLSAEERADINAEDDSTILIIENVQFAVEQDTSNGISSVGNFSNDTGTSNTDRITNNSSQTFTVTASVSTSGSSAPTLFVSTDAAGATRTQGTIQSGWTNAQNLASVTFTFSNYSLSANSTTLYFWAASTGGNALGTQTYTLDQTLPTVTITDNITGTAKAGDTVTFTFTFSETVTGFDTNDITVVNGTKGTFSGSGTTYTLDVTPTASSSGNITVNVSTTGVTDAAGNQATAPAQYLQAFDTTVPTVSSVTITGTDSNLAIGEVITVTVATSEAVTVTGTPTFAIAVGSNTRNASYVAGSSTSTSLVFQYTIVSGDSDTSGGITSTANAITGGTIADAAGNPLNTTNTVAAANTIVVDGTVPILTITDNIVGTAKAGDTVTFTFTFSETVTGFDTNDITVVNGTKGTFSGSGTTYTLDVTPTASSSGNITVDVSTTGVTDAAGNQATAPAQYLQAFDTTAPTVSSVTITGTDSNLAIGEVITVTVATSEAVTVTGTPTFAIAVGSNTRNASYVAGSSTSTSLVFQYTIVSGDSDTSGGITSAAGAISGGTIADAAGNPLNTSNTVAAANTILVDGNAPTASVVIAAINTDTGTATDFITSDTSLTVSGTNGALGSGETIQISSNGGSSWSNVTQNTTTSWSFIDPTVRTNGTFTYQVRVVDAAGNIGNTASQAVTVDTTAPTAAVAITAISDDTGAVGDFITSDTTLTVSGTNGALGSGETIQISSNGGTTWSDVTQATATTWSFTDPTVRTNGPFTYQVRIVDAAGNVGTTASQGVTINTNVTAISATPATYNLTNNSLTYSISRLIDGSTTTAGSDLLVALYNDTTGTSSALIGWQLINRSTAFASNSTYNGTFNLTAVGVTRVNGSAFSIRAWVGTAGNSATYGTGNDGSPAITYGTANLAEGAATGFTVNSNTAPINTGPGAGRGAVTFTGTVTGGSVLTANSSGVIVDTIAPTTTAAISTITDDLGFVTGSLSSGSSTDDTTPQLSGTISAPLGTGETVRIFDGATFLGNAQVTGTSWTYTDNGRALTNNQSISYLAYVADAAGNLSAASTAYTLTIDTEAPVTTAAVTGLSDDAGSIQGNVASGGFTDDTSLTVSGTLSALLVAGETVRIFDGATYLGNATVTGTTWSYSDSRTLTNNQSLSYTARVADAVGNQSTAGTAYTATVDTTAPTVTITAIGGGDTTVSTQTNDNLVVGSAEANRTVTLFSGATQLGTTTADASGNFTYTLTAPNLTTIGQGSGKAITASQSDAAGNTGTSAAFSFAVDTVAPTVTITSIGGLDSTVSSQTNDNLVVGSAEANRTVTLFSGATQLGTTTADASGNFTYTLTAPNLTTIGQGSGKAITASQSDAAGNTGTSAAFSFVVDTVAPTVTDANITISGASGSGGAYKIGDTVTAVFDPGIQAGELASVTVDFSAFGGGSAVSASLQTSGDNNGKYLATYTIVAGSIDSNNRNVSVTARDLAGNTTTTSDTTNATLDNIAPTVTDPRITITSTGSGTGGSYRRGDTIAVRWDNSAGGDNNPDTISSVTASVFGQSVTLTNAAGIWTGSIAVNDIAATDTTSSASISLTVTDNAGNTTTTADTTSITIDNIAPVVSPGTPAAIVEAGGIGNAVSGNASATINLNVSGGSIDLSHLQTTAGWTLVAGNTYTKAGTYGSATLDVATGAMTYTLDDNDTDTQALTAGQSVADSFGAVRVVDAAGNSTVSSAISFAITGSNDSPLLNANGVNVIGDQVYEISFDPTVPQSARVPVALMRPDSDNLTDVDSSSFKQIRVAISGSQVQNGSDEKLLIRSGSTTVSSLDLAATTGDFSGSQAFTFNALSYTASWSQVGVDRVITISRTAADQNMAEAETEALLDALFYTNTATTVSTSARRSFDITVTDADNGTSNSSDTVVTLGEGARIDLDGDGTNQIYNRSLTFIEDAAASLLAAAGTNLQPLYSSAAYEYITGAPANGFAFTDAAGGSNGGGWSYTINAADFSGLTAGQSQTFTIAYRWTNTSDTAKTGQHFFNITVTNTGTEGSPNLVASSNRPLTSSSGSTITGQLAPSVDRLGIGINTPLFVDQGHEFLVIQGASLLTANGQSASGAVQLDLRSAPSTSHGGQQGTWGTFSLGGVDYRYEFVRITGDTNNPGLNRIFFTRSTGSGIGGTLTYAEAEALIDVYSYLNTSDAPQPVSVTGGIASYSRTLNFGVFSEGIGNIPATATITVTPVNDAPSGTNNTITVNEDAGYTFSATDFGFSDPADNGAHSLAAVVISSLPSAGGLSLNGVAVTQDQVIAVATLSQLVYTPGANATGSGYATFGFKVQDDGGTANGGVDTSTEATITVNVTPVNDAPVGVNDAGSATEAGGIDNGTPGSAASGNVLTNDTDIDTSANLLSVSAVRTGASEGSGTPGTLGAALVGTYGSLTLDASGSYTYVVNEANAAVQALNTGGTLTDSFNYTVSDGSLSDTAVLTITINGANDAPVITSATTASVPENTIGAVYTVTASDVDSSANSITYSIDGGVDGNLFNINSTTGAVTFKTQPSFAAPSDNGANNVYDISVRASDGAGSFSASQAVAITVTPVDSVAPTLNITDNDANTVNIADGTVTFTFTFSEAVTGFDASKVTVVNGTKGSFTPVNGAVYTLVVTPTASSFGNISVTVNTSGVTDGAGNQALAPASYIQPFDTLAPTATLTAATIPNTSSVTARSSESGTGYLVNSAVTVTNIDSITGASDDQWNAISISAANTDTILAATGLSDGTYRLYAVDGAGNLSSASTASVTIDSTAPTAIADVTAVNSGDTGPVISSGGTVSGSSTLLVSGTAQQPLQTGEIVQVFDVQNGNTYLGNAFLTTDRLGWSFQDRRALSTGQTVRYRAKVTDLAGNQSAFGSDYTIIRSSSLPVISVQNVSLVEGDPEASTPSTPAPKQGFFTVVLSQASSQAISVSYEFIAGTAIAGTDYSAASGVQTLSIPSGVTAVNIPFTVFGEKLSETNETFTLRLSSPSGATFASGSTAPFTATATIINDDPTLDGGVTNTTGGNNQGSSGNDILTGDNTANTLNGYEGNDTLTGAGAADVLAGGTGNDRFRYTSFSDSTLANLDFISDFDATGGDKIMVNGIDPSTLTLFNRGSVSSTTLTGALNQVFTDTNLALAGNQGLTAGQAVVFSWGSNPRLPSTYIAVSDGNNANYDGDFLLRLPSNQRNINNTNIFMQYQ